MGLSVYVFYTTGDYGLWEKNSFFGIKPDLLNTFKMRISLLVEKTLYTEFLWPTYLNTDFWPHNLNMLYYSLHSTIIVELLNMEYGVSWLLDSIICKYDRNNHMSYLEV